MKIASASGTGFEIEVQDWVTHYAVVTSGSVCGNSQSIFETEAEAQQEMYDLFMRYAFGK